MDSYSTPIVMEHNGKSQVVSHSNGYLCGYDPATGGESWHFDNSSTQIVTTPVLWNGVIIVGGGIQNYLRAVGLGAEGDVVKPRLIWEERRQLSDLPSPVVYSDYLYMIMKNGIATCREASTGEERWKKRIPGEYFASVTAADGKIYFCNSVGLTTVLAAGPEFKVLSRNPLDEEVQASFAISKGQLFIRGKQHLYCIGTAR